jgi:hypothetical protein
MFMIIRDNTDHFGLPCLVGFIAVDLDWSLAAYFDFAGVLEVVLCGMGERLGALSTFLMR